MNFQLTPLLFKGMAALALTSLLTSCNDPAATGLAGSVMQTVGSSVGYHGGGRDAAHALHAAGQIVVAYSIYQSYRITREQEEIARARAAQAVRSPEVKRSKAKYVAVPVPKKKPTRKGPKEDLVVVDKETGEPVDQKVYETTSTSQLSSGSVGNLGGHEAVVYSGMQGV
ncbi:MAG TPA: hypothetical protein VNQ90_07070 [Chthoniobacteraceae bacterium]|nr:hypothetical protein [Chthoniobacteraceae bacterium]